MSRAAVADDDDVAGDDGRTRARVGQLVIDDGVGFPEFPAGAGVEGVQPAIDRGNVHLAFPHRDTAVDQVAARVARHEVVGFGIVTPQLLAGGRIDCVDVSPRARGVHHAVDDNRRRLLSAHGRAEIVGPGEPELVDVARVQLVERGVVAPVRIATARIPVLGFGGGILQSRGIDVARARGGAGGHCREQGRRQKPGGLERVDHLFNLPGRGLGSLTHRNAGCRHGLQDCFRCCMKAFFRPCH